ncbi:MAG: NUDIX domain-containing protein [bacterium]|nr:NUDIX domain-containing protein [bacterium]
MPIQRLGGAVVYAKHGGEIYLALVHDIFGHWTLSKGKIGDNPDIANESAEEGTVREIKEELGLDIKIKANIGENEYIASDPEAGKKRKQVTYFLAESPYTEIKLEQKGGLDDGKWFKLADALELNFYEDVMPLVQKAIQKLHEKTKK